MSTPEPRPGLIAPLRSPDFRRLLAVYLACFTSSALVDVSAAWSLAAAGASPGLVAMASTAASLPVVLLILPFGAIADTSSRVALVRRAQAWSASVAALLALAALVGGLAPWVVLPLVLANGIGMAMRLPSLTALAPAAVAPRDLPEAMTLFGMGSSATRLAGPALAAGAFALAGASAAFALAAAMAFLAMLLARGLPEPARAEVLPGERILGAVRVAWSYTGQSPEFRLLLLRGFTFFLLAACAFALAPLAVTQRLQGGATLYMLMMGATGFGALLGGLALPRVRGRWGPGGAIRGAALLVGVAAALIAFAPLAGLAMAGSVLHGIGWLWGLSSFTGLAQQILPDWMRARGMAVTHAALIGGVALGAALWGQVANLIGPGPAIAVAGALGALAALLPGWQALALPPEAERTAHRYWAEPALALPVAERQGPALIVIDYRVDPGRIDAFLEAARESRRLRLRSGALSWSLFRDLERPGHFIEQVVFAEWGDRLRQPGRTTEADLQIKVMKQAAMEEGAAPRVEHWLAVAL